MENKIEFLEKEYRELFQKSLKSKEDIELQQQKAVELEKARREEERSLVDDLIEIGLDVKSIWDLVNTKMKYPKAVPVLIEHLVQHYSDRTKEGLVRALAVKEAAGRANRYLIDEYNKMPKEKTSLCWAIGNTIFSIITKEDEDAILLIAEDKENGMSRQMFVSALGKINSFKVEQALIRLLVDDEVVSHAIDALGKLRSNSAKDEITKLLNHPKPLVRNMAKKALKKL